MRDDMTEDFNFIYYMKYICSVHWNLCLWDIQCVVRITPVQGVGRYVCLAIPDLDYSIEISSTLSCCEKGDKTEKESWR